MTTEIQTQGRKPFDIEAVHPLYPRPEILAEYKKVGMEYEPSVHDRAYKHWYSQTKGRPVDAEVAQIYRRKIAREGEFLLYNITLRGNDWKGNEQDFGTLRGRYEKPIFRLERNPETQETSATQISSHKTIYDIPYTREKLDELLEMSTEPVSLIVFGAGGRKYGILSVEDYRNGTIEDLVVCGDKGLSLDTVLKEKGRTRYQAVEDKEKEKEKENQEEKENDGGNKYRERLPTIRRYKDKEWRNQSKSQAESQAPESESPPE